VLGNCGPNKGEPTRLLSFTAKSCADDRYSHFGKRVGFEIGVRQQNLQSKRYINPFAKHAEQANLHYAILRKSYRVQFAKTSFKMH